VRFTFLGTAAAERYPALYCRCSNCVEARALGGPNLRKCSAALVNHALLIDLGPDLPVAAQLHGLDLTYVPYALQTHDHPDHLYRINLHHHDPWGTNIVPVVLNW